MSDKARKDAIEQQLSVIKLFFMRASPIDVAESSINGQDSYPFQSSQMAQGRTQAMNRTGLLNQREVKI